MVAPAETAEEEVAAPPVTSFIPEDDDLGSSSGDEEEEEEDEEEESEEEKKPSPDPVPLQLPSDNGERKRPRLETNERKPLFQRLFTEEDEIAILQGFLDFNSRRSGYYHDTTPFYEQIRSRLQLDFNKTQLYEKIRRLKKKYRTLAHKKDYAFKSAHEQAVFELSRRIWGASVFTREEDDDDDPPPPLPLPLPTSTERRRGKAKPPPETPQEEASRGFLLSPALKEMLFSAVGGPIGHLPQVPPGNAAMEEKWRKQQILELEVYSKRIELVQEQVKLMLEELRKP